MSSAYKPQDTLSLWWLGNGHASPQRVGQLLLTNGNRTKWARYRRAKRAHIAHL